MRALPCALVGAVVIAGCGGGGKKSSDVPTGTPDPQAKTAAQAYLDAYTAKDAKAICARLTPLVQKQLADNKGTCLKTIRSNIKNQKYPKLTVAKALSTGDTAAAFVQGSKRQVRLQRVAAAWKVYDGGS
jgi:hypothetical protein